MPQRNDRIMTCEEIEDEDDNMLVKLDWPRLQEEFFTYLDNHTRDIQGIVYHHLPLPLYQKQCTVADRSEWRWGDFNVCIPISVGKWRTERLLLRCPFPHKLGGLRNTDSMDEKIRCEAATFAWISKKCEHVPVPRLWGFGLPSGLCFTPVASAPWNLRASVYVQRIWAWICRKPRWRPFIPHQSLFSLKSGYLLMDFIEKTQGIMLSDIWPPHTINQKQNLYKSMSRIMLDLARHPLEKIGSFTIHNSGEIKLSNRPLTLRLAVLENEDIPTEMPRDRCYSTTDLYLYDLLHCLDLKLRHQPNAVRNKYDAEAQMAVHTILRALLPYYIEKNLRHGPFTFTWTDPHASNIFVDKNYNITSIVDLEWFCSLPTEVQHPPFWLSGHAVDDLDGENEHDFMSVCDDFLEVLAKEEDGLSLASPGFYNNTMREAVKKGMHWFWACVQQPRATYNLFLDHVQPHFAPTHSQEEEAIQFQQIVGPYWTYNAPGFIDRKISERSKYLHQLKFKYGTQTNLSC